MSPPVHVAVRHSIPHNPESRKRQNPPDALKRWVQPSFAGRAKSYIAAVPFAPGAFPRLSPVVPPVLHSRPPDDQRGRENSPSERCSARGTGNHSTHRLRIDLRGNQTGRKRNPTGRAAPLRPYRAQSERVARLHAAQPCAMRPASCARHVLRRSALACSVLAVRRASHTRKRAGPHWLLGILSAIKAAALCRQSQADATAHLLPLPASAASRKRMQLLRVSLVSSGAARPVPPAAVALVRTGWRVASSACRCFCACAASVGFCWFSRLVRCLASRCCWLRRGAAGPARRGCCRCWCWFWCGCCSPCAGGLPRPRCWWCPCLCCLCCLGGVVRPSGASGGAGSPPRCGAPPPVVVGRCLGCWCCFLSAGCRCSGGYERGAPPGRSTVSFPGQMLPSSYQQGYGSDAASKRRHGLLKQARNGQKPPEIDRKRHQNVTKSPCTILQKNTWPRADQLRQGAKKCRMPSSSCTFVGVILPPVDDVEEVLPPTARACRPVFVILLQPA